MRRITRLAGIASALFILSAAVVAPAVVSADWRDSYGDRTPRSVERASDTARERASDNAIFKRASSGGSIKAGPITLCPTVIEVAGISVNVYLPGPKDCGDEPEPEEPTLTFSANPSAIEEGGSSTLEWSSDNADTCTASNGWSGSKALSGSQSVSPTQTTTYTLMCEGEGGDVKKSVQVTVTPDEVEPGTLTVVKVIVNDDGGTATTSDFSFEINGANETAFEADGSNEVELEAGTYTVTEVEVEGYTVSYQNCEDIELAEGGSATCTITNNDVEPEPEGTLLITEVYYDVPTTTGEAEGANEWVEIYNGTNSAINLSDYSIADGASSDALPDVELPADSYAVITASSTTESFWTIPVDAVVVVLSGNIGNGLGNSGDLVELIQNAGTTTIDAVSYGDNTEAFSPSVPDVEANSGHSIARDPVDEDTDTAADWVDRATPTPGE